MIEGELLSTVLLQFPNVAVSLLALWYASRLIERLIGTIERLVDRLLDETIERD